MTAGRPEDAAAVERELERIVAEAEAKLAEVRRELAERRLHEAQHAEIDRLEEHLANAGVRWGEVREFFDEVLAQLRSGGTAGGDAGTAGSPDAVSPDDGISESARGLAHRRGDPQGRPGTVTWRIPQEGDG